MAAPATLKVNIVTDASKAQAGLNKTESAIDRFSKKVGGLGKAASVAFLALGAAAGVAAVAVGVDAVKAASDMNETLSKTKVVLGSAAADVLSWSEKSARSMGQSRQAALDAATTFAIFGKNAGKSGKDLAGFSEKMTQLAGDMASFSNTSPQDAVEALTAALRGENDPLERYGVLLNDAVERQEAVRLGLIKTTSQALTPQQRVLAATSVILKQTNDAQGDFARTSAGLANQQRILSASLEDAKVKLGTALLPVVVKAVTLFNQAWPAIEKIADSVSKKLGPVLTDFVGWLQTKGTQAWQSFLDGFSGKKLSSAAGTLQTVFHNIGTSAQNMVTWFQTKFLPWWNTSFLPAWDDAVKKIGPVLTLLSDPKLLSNLAQLAAAFLVVRTAVNLATIALDGFKVALAVFTSPITAAVAIVAGLATVILLVQGRAVTVGNILGVIAGSAIQLGSALVAFFKGVFDVIFTILSGAFTGFSKVFAPVLDFFGAHGLAKELRSQAKEFGDWKTDVDGHLQGVIDKMNGVADNLDGNAKKVKGSLDSINPHADGVGAALTLAGGKAGAISAGAASAAGAANGHLDSITTHTDGIGAAMLRTKAKTDSLQASLSNLHAPDVFIDVFWRTHGVPPSGVSGGRSLTLDSPRGATGGIVTRPTFALIGEAGPEAVIPLNRTPGSSPLPGLGNIVVNNNFYGAVTKQSGVEAGREIVNALREYERRNGRGWAA